MNNHRSATPLSTFIQTVAILLFIAVLYVARDVLIPLTLGVLFAFLLSPIVNRLQRLGCSNVSAVIVTAGVVFSALGLFLMLLWSGFTSLSDELPKYQREVVAKVSAMRGMTSGIGAQFTRLWSEVSTAMDESSEANGQERLGTEEQATVDQTTETLSDGVVNDGSNPRQPLYVVSATPRTIDLASWAGNLAALLGPIGTAGLVTVFSLFALIYRDDLRDRITSLVAQNNYVVTTEALNEASQRISRYLLAQMILNISYGAIFGIGLTCIGYMFAPDGVFPYVLLLGTIAGVVRFVPYVGPIVGAAVPLMLSIALFPGYSIFVAVAVLITTMELLSNNVVEPWLYGSSTGVSAVAVITSAVFWGWLWGPIGLLLATPLTVCAMVLGTNVPRFQFLAKLLSEKVQLKPSIRGYQRLLSGDTHKLSEFLQAEIDESGASVVVERIIIPVIKLVLMDRDSHGVNDAIMFDRLWTGMLKVDLLYDPKPTDNLEGEVAEKSTTSESLEAAPLAPTEVEPLPLGIAIAARHRGEEIVLSALAHQLRDSVQLVSYDQDDIPDVEANEIAAMTPAVIVIAVIPPRGLHEARYWCRALRAAGYKGYIIVACFGRFKNFERLFLDVRRSGANWFTTTVDQTSRRVRSVANRSKRKRHVI